MGLFMARPICTLLLCLAALALLPFAGADERALTSGGVPPGDQPTAASCTGHRFHDTWIKVGERLCLKCHVDKGEAAESDFVLRDALGAATAEQAQAMRDNYAALRKLAVMREEDGRARLLVKATGGLDHGGGEVLKVDSSEFRVLEEFVQSRQLNAGSPVADSLLLNDVSEDLFAGVQMISDQRLLRRVTLALAARLPEDSERAAVEAQGLPALKLILRAIMSKPAFEQRMLEGLNDIFLTLGYNGNGEDILSYDHFQHTRHWYQKHSLDHLPEKDRQKARYKLADQYREALRREPLELIRYIVRENRSFTEILTADYTMVSPYTARGYGIFEELEDQFDDPENPFEFIPARLKPLKGRSGKVQPTADGVYPHAGLLSMFQYLRRYPTTETNRNRLRARMVYQHFLGVDIMALAPRVSDAAAVDAKYEVPTMQAAECVVCHRTIDPIAGLFQDYYNEDGHYGPRKEGWFTDIFAPGREGVDLPEAQRWRALPWLSAQTVEDPRFAVAMSEHVYYILMGRKVMLRPDDIDDPHFSARRRAHLAQRQWVERAAARFTSDGFNIKSVFEDLIMSPLYRADGLSAVIDQPNRLAELDDLGVVRLLSPEQIERKIVAVFGRPWGRLKDSYEILYGGIDSQEVTERLTEPSGAIGAIQRIMANDVACKNVAADFAIPAGERRLFPGIELDQVPGDDDPDAEPLVRAAMVHLHQHILGRDAELHDAELDRSYQLFVDIIAEAKEHPMEQVESYFCKSGQDADPRDADPHYTLRAWRAIVTYLLRQADFLYE